MKKIYEIQETASRSTGIESMEAERNMYKIKG